MKNFNMMKKLLALTLGAAMLLAVMTGCGKKDTAQEPADDQQQQQEEQQPAEPAEYTWSFTPADTANYNGATGELTLYSVSTGGGGGGGSW